MIPGHEGYEVSDHGRVRNARTLHVLSPGRGKYLQVTLGNRAKNKYVHHLVLMAFVGPRPDGMECLHRNSDNYDNRLENLHWGTSSENKHDVVRNGTHPMAKRTHCKRGHPLESPNLVDGLLRRGSRQCKACNRAYGFARPADATTFQALSDRYYAAIMAED